MLPKRQSHSMYVSVQNVPRPSTCSANGLLQYWGIIATIAFCLATALAILPLRIKYYEFFLITHIVLVVIVLVGCWYHIVPHFGFDYGYQVWLYIAFAFWSFDRVARIARIAYYNRIGNSRATIEAIPGCDIVQLTVFPRTWSFGPGQHTFVYFPGIGKFWESHPFSVAGWKTRGQTTSAPITRAAFPGSDEKEIQVKNSALHSVDSASPTASAAASQRAASSHANQVQEHTSIQFLVRVHAGVTSTLRNRIASSPSGTRTEISAYTEGPHAGHRATLQSLWVADTVLCLAGGIGITNALGFIQEFANLSHHGGEAAVRGRGIMRNTKRFILAWSARESGLIEHVKRNFLVDVEGIEYSFWHTGTSAIATQTGDSLHDDNEKSENLVSATIEGYTAGRMDIGSVIRSSVEPGHQTTVLVCGPGHMADEATQQVVNCLKDGHKIDLIEEAYAW